METSETMNEIPVKHDMADAIGQEKLPHCCDSPMACCFVTFGKLAMCCITVFCCECEH